MPEPEAGPWVEGVVVQVGQSEPVGAGVVVARTRGDVVDREVAQALVDHQKARVAHRVVVAVEGIAGEEPAGSLVAAVAVEAAAE